MASTPEPQYTVIKKYLDFEIRRYKSVLVAETLIPTVKSKDTNSAFTILAKYIFGKNQSQARERMERETSHPIKIPMTAPVNLDRTTSGAFLQFFLPSEILENNAPTPDDARVKIRRIPERIIGVKEYSGIWSENRFELKAKELIDALKSESYVIKSNPIFARYDPPWKPWFLRRNEVWIEVELPGSRV